MLMSTHYIEEAERLADTVAVMARGRDRRARQARPSSCASTRATQTHEVYGPPARLEELRAQGERAGWAMRRSGPGAGDPARRAPRRRRCPRACGAPATLEDAFVVLTGEEIE